MIFHCSVPKKGLVGNRSAASIRLPTRLFEPVGARSRPRAASRDGASSGSADHIDQLRPNSNDALCGVCHARVEAL